MAARVLLLVAALLAALATAARAQPPLEGASSLVRRGNERFGQGHYAEALELYRAAQKLTRGHRLDYNIGKALLRLGRPASAATRLERFLEHADDRALDEQAAAAKELLARLAPTLASVQVEGPPEGAVVVLDGRPAGKAPLAHRIYLRPGEHRLLILWRGRTLVSRRLTLAPGQRRRVKVLPGPPRGAAGGQGHQGGQAPTPLELASLRRERTTWAYTTLATGLALTAGAGVLLGLGVDQGEQAHADYLTLTASPGAREQDVVAELDRIDRAKSLVVVGGVLAGAAVVAFGLSALNFLTRPDEQAPEPVRQARGPALTLYPTTGGGGLSLSGAF